MVLRPEDGPAGLQQTAFPYPDGEASSLAPPPHYGEHTASLLRTRLDRTDEDIRALSQQEVIHL
ncbi:MAG: hypothetical protein R6T83_08540 [Salinibacter sp.]